MFLILGYKFADSFDRAIVRQFGCFDDESIAHEMLHKNFLNLEPTGFSKSFKNNIGVFWIKKIVLNKMITNEINVPDPL